METQSSPVASWRHTTILLGIFAVMTAAGVASRPVAGTVSSASRIGLYVSLVAAECGLVYYMRNGTRRRGISLATFIGDNDTAPSSIVRDVVIAAAMWLVWMGVTRLLPDLHSQTVSAFVPRTSLESSVWIVLSLAAGVAEELVFRGYFLRQITALTGSVAAGVAIQAVLFGVVHGYQGVAACMHITLYGLLFGTVAVRCRSLRPGMIAHAWTDIAAGLLFR